jgi:4-alpha-glucanotransferase
VTEPGRLDELGIWPRHTDAFGRTRELDPQAAATIIAAMGLEPGAPVPQHHDRVMVLPQGSDQQLPAGRLVLEDGGTLRVEGILPPDVPLGSHLLARDDGLATTLHVCPARCRTPVGRHWGWAVQLFATRSARSWGIGDLEDLRVLAAWSRTVGAGALLLNPLDAVMTAPVHQGSPYSPSSRRFRDTLTVAIDMLPGVSTLDVDDRAILAALADEARGDGRRIDRGRSARAKRAALDLLWRDSQDDPARAAARDAGLDAHLAARGAELERFAIFETLVEEHGAGWRRWPAGLSDPHSSAVARFAADHRDRVRQHAWLQWQLDEQLAAAARELPLVHDLPIGFDPEGADAWEFQHVLADGVSIGAPPDELGPEGQDWQIPPFVPWKLRAAGYEPYIATLRGALRHAAGLRVDHVLGLFRLFWVPPTGARDGAYVTQDRDALLDLLALEAHRARAWVIGEDLGNVMEGVREELELRGILRTRVLWFEQDAPPTWDRQGLATVTTHDLPAVATVWERSDPAADRVPNPDAEAARLARLRDDLIARSGLAPDADTASACVRTAELIATSGCDLALFQLDDAVAATHRINVPGTDARLRPDNWNVPLPVLLDELPTHPLVDRVVTALSAGRQATEDSGVGRSRA